MTPSKTIHKVLNFRKPCSFLSLLKISIHRSRIRAKWNLSPPKSHPVHLRSSVSLPESPAPYPNPEDQPTRELAQSAHVYDDSAVTQETWTSESEQRTSVPKAKLPSQKQPSPNSKVASSELQNKLQCLWT